MKNNRKQDYEYTERFWRAISSSVAEFGTYAWMSLSFKLYNPVESNSLFCLSRAAILGSFPSNSASRFLRTDMGSIWELTAVAGRGVASIRLDRLGTILVGAGDAATLSPRFANSFFIERSTSTNSSDFRPVEGLRLRLVPTVLGFFWKIIIVKTK